MKKINIFKNLCSLLILSITVFLLTSCALDKTIPRSFEVKFITNVENININPISIKEGYHIESSNLNLDLVHPDSSKNAIFRGWYSDEKFVNYWNLDTYRVSDNMTLYARWSYPVAYPTEIAISSKALSKSITWIQDDATSKSMEVYIVKGTNYYYDDVLEEWRYGDKFVYPDETTDPSLKIKVNGNFEINGFDVTYHVSDIVPGGYYKVIIETAGYETQTCNDICFKGTGLKEDPYLIFNESDLTYISTNSFSSETYVELKSDITLHSLYSSKMGCIFNGKFNGNLFTINLKNNSGLFYELGEDAEVYNVKFTGALSGSDPSIGVVANYNRGKIHNISSLSVAVTSQGGKVNDISSVKNGGAGAIVGTNYQTGSITECIVESGQANLVSGKIALGGVAGINYGKIYNMTISAIIGAYNGNESSQTVANSFSGICVGINYGVLSQINSDGKINVRRIEDGDIYEGAANIGGVVGYNAKGAVISECIFQGMRCVGDTNVGGIAGYNDGIIEYCYSGRRIRRPSNTTDVTRQFISPVTGSYNVGGIAGLCGENSKITNCFSTANVWSYQMKGYSVAEKADNSISVIYNQNYRTASTYLGQKYGVVFSNELEAPKGNNNIVTDNKDRVGTVENNLLGADFINGANKENTSLIVSYLTLLGDKFGYNTTYGISLKWQSDNTKGIESYR